MAINYKERLEKHIEALEKSYDNIILMLNEDIEKDEKGNVKLKDSQREVYAKGILKSSETAEYLLKQIKDKQAELEELNNPEKPKNGEPETPSETSGTGDSDLGSRLK